MRDPVPLLHNFVGLSSNISQIPSQQTLFGFVSTSKYLHAQKIKYHDIPVVSYHGPQSSCTQSSDMTTVLPRADQGVKEGIHVRVLDAPNVTKIDGSSAEVCLEKHIPEVSGDGKAGDDSARWLTVSPYLDPEHLLDLNTVDTPNRLLALAATQLEPATADYAIVKYEDAFEWTSFMTDLKSLADRENYRWTRQEFYVVEFRSQLKKNIDVDLLFQLDKLSHVEATAGGGLLKYWYGVPNAERQNLATCK